MGHRPGLSDGARVHELLRARACAISRRRARMGGNANSVRTSNRLPETRIFGRLPPNVSANTQHLPRLVLKRTPMLCEGL